jgi:hypothetical protein
VFLELLPDPIEFGNVQSFHSKDLDSRELKKESPQLLDDSVITTVLNEGEAVGLSAEEVDEEDLTSVVVSQSESTSPKPSPHCPRDEFATVHTRCHSFHVVAKLHMADHRGSHMRVNREHHCF